MTSYEFGEIALVDFPQTGSVRRKRRPALVVLDIGDADIILAPVTTKERSGRGDYRLKDWQISGLLRDSWVRLAKADTIRAIQGHKIKMNDRDLFLRASH